MSQQERKQLYQRMVHWNWSRESREITRIFDEASEEEQEKLTGAALSKLGAENQEWRAIVEDILEGTREQTKKTYSIENLATSRFWQLMWESYQESNT